MIGPCPTGPAVDATRARPTPPRGLLAPASAATGWKRYAPWDFSSLIGSTRWMSTAPADISISARATPPLPPWLVIEAVGQLAAWIAMARSDFASRPVAALVGEARVDATAWRDRRRTGRADAQHRTPRRSRHPLLRQRARCGGPRDRRAVALRRSAAADGAVRRPRASCASASRRCAAAAERCARSPRPCVAAGDRTSPSMPTACAARRLRRAGRGAVLRRSLSPPAGLSGHAAGGGARCSSAAPPAAAALGGARRACGGALRDYKVRAFSPPGQRARARRRAARRCATASPRCGSAPTTDGKRIASGALDYRVAP